MGLIIALDESVIRSFVANQRPYIRYSGKYRTYIYSQSEISMLVVIYYYSTLAVVTLHWAYKSILDSIE